LNQYIEAFDVKEIGTLLNLQEWAKNRGISCTFKIKRRFSSTGLMLHLLLLLYPYLKNRLPPVKKERDY